MARPVDHQEQYPCFLPIACEVSGEKGAHQYFEWMQWSPDSVLALTRLEVRLFTGTYEVLDPWEAERFYVDVRGGGRTLFMCPVPMLNFPGPIKFREHLQVDLRRDDKTPLTIVRGGAWVIVRRGLD